MKIPDPKYKIGDIVLVNSSDYCQGIIVEAYFEAEEKINEWSYDIKIGENTTSFLEKNIIKKI